MLYHSHGLGKFRSPAELLSRFVHTGCGALRHVASFLPHTAGRNAAPQRTASGVNEPSLRALLMIYVINVLRSTEREHVASARI